MTRELLESLARAAADENLILERAAEAAKKAAAEPTSDFFAIRARRLEVKADAIRAARAVRRRQSDAAFARQPVALTFC